MYKKIIVALSLEHGIAEKAIEAARNLSSNGAEILAVHVYEPFHGSVSTYLSDEDISKAHDQIRQRLDARVAGQEGVEAVLMKGHPGRSITDLAHEVHADCIIVASHKPGLSDYFLGSTAARIVRHAPCSVHVLR